MSRAIKPQRNGFLWSDLAIAALRTLTEAGVSASETARRLQAAFERPCTRNSVISARSRYCAPPLPRPLAARDVAPEGEKDRSAAGRAGGIAAAAARARRTPTRETDYPPEAPPPAGAGRPFAETRGCLFETSGKTRPENFRFCDAPKRPGSSYCETHHRVVWTLPVRKAPQGGFR